MATWPEPVYPSVCRLGPFGCAEIAAYDLKHEADQGVLNSVAETVCRTVCPAALSRLGLCGNGCPCQRGDTSVVTYTICKFCAQFQVLSLVRVKLTIMTPLLTPTANQLRSQPSIGPERVIRHLTTPTPQLYLGPNQVFAATCRSGVHRLEVSFHDK